MRNIHENLEYLSDYLSSDKMIMSSPMPAVKPSPPTIVISDLKKNELPISYYNDDMMGVFEKVDNIENIEIK